MNIGHSISDSKYRIKRAIIMAAGKGERMRPVTEKTPKPLIAVNGKRMIDSIIEGLHLNGITEIYVVVGYLKEQFKGLEEDYSGIRLIENPYYENSNNISSLYVARDYLENCFIIDGDQIVYNSKIFDPYFDRSGYCSAWIEEETNEWLQFVEGGIVKSCSRNGGNCGWQLFSVSMWNEQDGKKLQKYLEVEFNEEKNWGIYWDDIAMFCYPSDFELGIRPMRKEDIVEIDSFQELIAIDKTYEIYVG